MTSILRKALKLLVGDDKNVDWLKLPKIRDFQVLTERELLTLESEIGAKLFGPVPAGSQRAFFCLDDKTWIWYEEQVSAGHRKSSNTIRYEITERGVLKVQENSKYNYLVGDELKNFAVAVQMYYEQVARGVYKRDAATGQKLV